jgi:tRNA(fMet)-specific endonuclease VapC
MIAFDTDVFTDLLRGVPKIVERALAISPADQGISIVVAEEILRGRLNAVRQAEAGKLRITVASAYELLRESLSDFRRLAILPFTDHAESLFRQWRSQRIRVATHDLRIAAVCIDHGARLASRNRRDFDKVPGLEVEYWT